MNLGEIQPESHKPWWKVTQNRRNIKTKAIALLDRAVTVGEPLQRSTTHHTGKSLDERIGSKAANVESILIRIIRQVSPEEYKSCLQNNGPKAIRTEILSIFTRLSSYPTLYA